jgi:uncharacterized SAM-binding protein YcdF (DUF218 family)
MSTGSKPGKKFGWKSTIVLCSLMIVCLGYATRSITLPMVGRWLDVGEVPQKNDFVMILNGDNRTRPFAAVDLFRQGYADKILVTSVKTKERHTAEPITHKYVRLILQSCEVPESKIVFVDSQCRSTFDEAQALRKFLAGQPEGTRVGVVTNEYHTRRTRWVFRRVLEDQMSYVQLLSAKTDFFDATNWWRHENGFVWYLSEFFKFSFYLFRYGNGLLWTGIATGIGVAAWCLRRQQSKNVQPNDKVKTAHLELAT